MDNVFSKMEKYWTVEYDVTATGVVGSSIPVTVFNFLTYALDGGTTAVKLQGSMDNANWFDLPTFQVDSAVPTFAIASRTAGGLYGATLRCSFVRFNCTTFAAAQKLWIGFSTAAFSPDSLSSASFNAALAAGSNVVGKVGIDVASSSVYSLHRLVTAAATTNATLVKATAGRVAKIRGYNAAAALRFLKLYNKATAPTIGTDAPVATFPLAPASVFDIDFSDIGVNFSTGIGYGITVALADNDTTALTAADIQGMLIAYT